MIRAELDANSFYSEPLTAFHDSMVKSLALIYIFSEIKSGHQLPKSLKEHFLVRTEKEVIDALALEIKRAKHLTLNMLFHYEEVNFKSLKMMYFATKTIVEFAPAFNIKDKALRDALVNGFQDVALSLGDHRFDKNMTAPSPHKPYLKPTYFGIKEVGIALTTQNIFTHIISKITTTKRPAVNQNETGKSCSGFFR